MAFAIDLRELRLAAHRNRSSDHLAGLRIDRRRVRAASIECEYTMRHRLVNNGVRILPRLHLAQNLQRLQIENRHVVVAAVAGEALTQIGGDRNPMHAVGARNSADQLIGSGIDHLGLRAVRYVQAVVGGVNVGVVPASPAADLDFVDNLISRRRGQGGARQQHEQEFFHDMRSLGDVPSHQIRYSYKLKIG